VHLRGFDPVPLCFYNKNIMTWLEMAHTSRPQINVLYAGNCVKLTNATRPILRRQKDVEDDHNPNPNPNPNPTSSNIPLMNNTGCYDTNTHDPEKGEEDEKKEGEEDEEKIVKTDSEELKDVQPTWAYVQKQIVGKGLLNVALLLHNGKQLKNLSSIDADAKHGLWVASLFLLVISLILQFVVTALLFKASMAPVGTVTDVRRAYRVNNVTMLLVYVIIVVNVFLFSFGLAGGDNPMEVMQAV